MKLIEETPYRFRIDPSGDMRVPGVVFASKRLLPEAAGDQSLQQVANVATLPGIVGASYAMPDIHWGYGFPIGGVAATDVRAGGDHPEQLFHIHSRGVVFKSAVAKDGVPRPRLGTARGERLDIDTGRLDHRGPPD